MNQPKLAISFSGGRSSAVMTKLCLEEYGDTHEIVVTFANTGCEHPATLDFVRDCDRYWGFNTVWLEAVISPVDGEGVRHKVVNYETASRNGEPFEAYIAKSGMPNPTNPGCTRNLKQDVSESYLRSLGWVQGKRLNYRTAIGIRADEIDRMSVHAERHGFVYPLVDKGITKAKVNAIMAAQPWDLKIPNDALGNCFSGDVRFITDAGTFSLSEKVGKNVNVLTREGWRSALISSFGIQSTLKVTLRHHNRTKVIEATPGHLWFVHKYQNGNRKYQLTKPTNDLRPGDRLVSNFIPADDIKKTEIDPEGVRHGFSFGDGSLEGGRCRTYIDNCKSDILPYFYGHEMSSGRRINNLPGHYKELPAPGKNEVGYLLGFLAGLVASDGAVSNGVSISNKDSKVIGEVVQIASSVGMVAWHCGEKVRDTNYKKNATLSKAYLPWASFPESMILRKQHRQMKPKSHTRPKSWEVVSVEFSLPQEVFCATVIDGPPEFTLEDNILVHNCTWCWKKTDRKLYTIAKTHPEVFDFPARMEREYGHVKAGDDYQATGPDGRRHFFPGRSGLVMCRV